MLAWQRLYTNRYLVVGLVGMLLLLALPVSAQLDPKVDIPGSGLSAASDLKTPLESIIKVILSFVGFLALLAIIYGGIKYIISLGDEKGTEQAKHIIFYAIIGLIIIALSAVIVNFVLGLPSGQGGNVGGGGNPNAAKAPGTGGGPSGQ